MAYSMTGIGEGRITEDGFDIGVLIRSVNHRFLNLQIRMPRGYQRYESFLRELISRKINRGKVDVNIEFHALPVNIGEIVVNYGYAVKLSSMIAELASKLSIPDGLTAERLVRFNDMFTALPEKEENEELKTRLSQAAELAFEDFISSRRIEGCHLSRDMKTRTAKLLGLITAIQNHAHTQPGIVKERLESALRKIASDVQIDPKRLEEETLMWSVRSDITEEITRINSHLNRLSNVLDEDRAMGKELDFIIQELHREITTIGSKSVVKEVNEFVVPVKLEIEKLREQAQNLE